MRIPKLSRWILVTSLWYATAITASAAPPKLDYFFPAGAQRGTTVQVTAGGAFERWPVQAHVEGAGLAVKPAKTSGKLAITVAKDAQPGVYWIRLFDADGASIARPFVVGLLPEVLEKEPNDDPQKPQVLASSNVVVNGRLAKPGDVDAFAVELTKGQTLVASLEAHQTLRAPMDGVLQILSADGFVLAQNDDYHGLDPQLAFPAPKDGTYLVRVFAFPAKPDASIRFAGKENFVYRLTLTTGPFVEYTLPLAVSATGPKTVELFGWNIPDELRRFPIAPRAGVERLGLFDPRFANAFSVWMDTRPCITRSNDRPQPIAAPITITGRLERPGDADVYLLQAKKGAKLSFRIAARTLGFPLDPVLRLKDDAGETLVQTKAAKIGEDASLSYTAKRDGGYRLEVGDLHGRGGFRYVYRLHAGPLAPDFELKVSSDRFTLTADKPLAIPVAVTRLGGFKMDIALHVEGLPKGVSATTSAKAITLHLKGKSAFAGPIRIVGTATDGTTRAAEAPVPELGRAAASLWLTAR